MAAVLNIADLIAGDNPADYRRLPVIIASNQCSAPVVQFQCGISQNIGDPKRSKLRANQTKHHHPSPTPLYNTTTNHHKLACLNKAAGADVTKTSTPARTQV